MDNIDRIMKEADRLGFGVSYGKYRVAYPNGSSDVPSSKPKPSIREKPSVVCVCCGNRFIQTHASQLYCSEECRYAAKRKRDVEYLRKKSGRPLVALCVICGSEFKPKNTRHKCCSKQCKEKQTAITQALWRAAHKKGER